MVSAPLFLDPIYDGSTDPTVIRNEATGKFYIFYTQRRSTVTIPGINNCFGTQIGVAESDDGNEWHYRGTLDLEFEFGHNTFWAPEIIYDPQGKLYHMYCTYIQGIFDTFERGFRSIEHYTSKDLFHWDHIGTIPLKNTGKLIDACVYQLPNGIWRMWFKDETDYKDYICYADSTDLYNWEYRGVAINDIKQEGPNVFEFCGKYWLISDMWDGLVVYSSDDGEHFTRQEERILRGPGTRKDDNSTGHHADIYVTKGRAYILYFSQPFPGHPDFTMAERWRTQMAELKVVDGILVCDRNSELTPDWV